MAGELKVTKIQATRNEPGGGDTWTVIGYMDLVTGGPGTPSSATFTCTDAEAASDTNIQSLLDAAIALVSSNTVDWTK